MVQKLSNHPSLRRVILSNTKESYSRVSHIILPTTLTFPSVRLIYKFNSQDGDQLYYRQISVGLDIARNLERQYHFRSLDLDFNNWHMFILQKLLDCLPSLSELKIKGLAQTNGWHYASRWEPILKNLKVLQHVTIDIYNFYPIRKPENQLQAFNRSVEQNYPAC